MINSFFDIPKDKLKEYYPQIIANSDAQYNIALDIVKAGQPGIAIPHLLISSEEMIKALVVALDHKGFKFRTVKGMDIFFRHHEIRFFLSAIIFSISLFGDDFINAIKRFKEDPTWFTKFYRDDPHYRDSRIKWYFMRKAFAIRAEIAWFSKAEVFRQNGFYVDMKGGLTTPINISMQEFEDTRVRIEKVNKIVKYAIDTFMTEDPEMVKQIESTKASFDNEKYYNLIETGISNVRKSKKSFFDTLKELVDSIFDRQDRKQTKKFNEAMERYMNKPINEKIAARYFLAPEVKENGLNTWTKLFVLTEDNILYCEYLEYMRPALVKKNFDFKEFKASDYSWGAGRFQHLQEIDYKTAQNIVLERQANWIDAYLQKKYDEMLEE
jgi:hypothetical protein